MSAALSKLLSNLGLPALPRVAMRVAFMFSLALEVASADSITFQITDGNLNAYQGPYADVTVTLNSDGTATITFVSATGSSSNCGSAGCYYLMGDGGSVAVNVNAESFTVSPVSATNSPLIGFTTPGPYTLSSGNEDGRGSFNLKLDGFDGWTHSADSISFTLTDTSGTWTSASEVLAANNKGYDAAIHFFPCIPDGSGTGCTSASPGAAGQAGTGYAAGTYYPPPAPETVPIPAAAWLFGSGLLGLIGIARRRKTSTLLHFA